MATTKYQGFPTYRYAQIALKGSNRVPQVIGDIRNINTNFESKEEVIQNPEEMNTQIAASHSYDMSQQNFSSPQKEPEFEVNYDNNVTALYQAISNSQWDVALETLQSNPQEARTWVVRYKEDNTKGIMWRFLPLHSACARQPPNSVLSSLLQAFPEGAGSCDDQGMYPLHYASGNQASAEVIRLLSLAFPPAASTCDPNGMLPIHYMAQWGPSETKAIDALLLANQQTNMKDDQGNTPLHYAEEGDYPFRQEMIAALKKGPISNVPKKKFQPSLPPVSKRNQNTSHQAAPIQVTKQQSLASNVSKLDDASVASNFAAPMKVVYKNQGSDASINTFANNSKSYPPSANKTVNRLTAQINKLKAELDFHSAAYEENLTTQREEHERIVEELNNKILQSMDDNSNVRKDIDSKTQYANHVQDRINEVEKDINHFNDQNDRLTKDLARHEEELRMEKSKAEAFQMKVKTLSSKMKSMIDDQKLIQNSLGSIENDMKAASDARKKKLKELYDEEMQYSNDLMVHKKVYGPTGPTVLSALHQQKSMMDNCLLVLSECEEKEN